MKYLKFINKIFVISLLVLMGIFLYPKIAWLAEISNYNILKETNNIRIKNGFSELKENILLNEAAQDKAKAIFKKQIFEHTIENIKFSSWIKNTGYEYYLIGENLAIDFDTSQGVIKAWMNSESHKKNILNNNFSEIGIASVKGVFKNIETTLVVEIFGAPLVKEVIEKNINNKIEYNNTTNLNLSSIINNKNLINNNYRIIIYIFYYTIKYYLIFLVCLILFSIYFLNILYIYNTFIIFKKISL